MPKPYKTIKRIVNVLLGFNAFSLIHLIRLEPMALLRVCIEAFNASIKLIPIPKVILGKILGDSLPIIQLSVMRYDDGILRSEDAMVTLHSGCGDAEGGVGEFKGRHSCASRII